jgi:hypothetical protein
MPGSYSPLHVALTLPRRCRSSGGVAELDLVQHPGNPTATEFFDFRELLFWPSKDSVKRRALQKRGACFVHRSLSGRAADL